jgi:hypothetical protein
MKLHFLGLLTLCLFILVGLDGVTPAQTNQRITAVTAMQERRNKPVTTTRQTTTKPMTKAATASLPTVDQVLNKYVVALGGKAAVERLTSRIITGTFELPAMGLKGSITMKAKAPNRSFSRVDLNGFGAIVQVYNGNEGFAADPTSGVRQLTGEELVATQIQSIFYKDLWYKEIYKKIEIGGKEKVGASEAVILIVTPPLGNPEKLYFDLTSGLLVREDAERESPQGKMQTATVYDDYRIIDSVNIPFVIKTTTPAMAYVVRVNAIKHNEAIDDSVFRKPDNLANSNPDVLARTRSTAPVTSTQPAQRPFYVPKLPASPEKPVRSRSVRMIAHQINVYSSPQGRIVGRVEPGSVLRSLREVTDSDSLRWYFVELEEGDMRVICDSTHEALGGRCASLSSGWVPESGDRA